MITSVDDRNFVRRQLDPIGTGIRIRYLRESQGISVIRMSDLIGVTPAAVYRWEKGRNLPDIGNVPSICDVLGKPFEQIFVCAP